LSWWKSSQFYLKFLLAYCFIYLGVTTRVGYSLHSFLVLDISAKKRKLELTKRIFTTIPHAVLTTIYLLNMNCLLNTTFPLNSFPSAEAMYLVGW
jgi:hypothetical protein